MSWTIWTKVQSVAVTLSLVALVFMGLYWFATDTREDNDKDAYWRACMLRYNAAQSERQEALDTAAREVAKQSGLKDAAHSRLLNGNWMRGSQESIDALDAFNEADTAKINAEIAMNAARNAHPPPKLERYCTRLKQEPEATQSPKAKGTHPAPKPSQTPKPTATSPAVARPSD